MPNRKVKNDTVQPNNWVKINFWKYLTQSDVLLNCNLMESNTGLLALNLH